MPGKKPGRWPGAACKAEFDAFLECGILAHGILPLRCGDCGLDKLVAHSRKRRGFCPSCGGPGAWLRRRPTWSTTPPRCRQGVRQATSSNRCAPTARATAQQAAVRCGADDRQALGQLCRTTTPSAQGRRARANQRRLTGRAQAQDPLARRHHAFGAEAEHKQSSGLFVPAEGHELCEGAACKGVAAGVHAAAGCVGDRRGDRRAPLPRPRLHLIRLVSA